MLSDAKELADRARVSSRTVWEAIKRAEVRGELEVYGWYEGYRAVISGYRLHLDGTRAASTRRDVTEPPPVLPTSVSEAKHPLIGGLLRRLI